MGTIETGGLNGQITHCYLNKTILEVDLMGVSVLQENE